MKATGHAARANLRIWWRELIVIAVCVLMVATRAYVAGFGLAGIIGIGWALGFAHRHRPLWDVIYRMDGKLDKAIGPATPAGGDELERRRARRLSAH